MVVARSLADITVVAAALVSVVLPQDAEAQQPQGVQICETGIISRIIVDNQPIFLVDELGEGSALRWAYSLANALHITTRQGFILREALFAEGDCMDPFLLTESGRILRQFPFFADAQVSTSELQDGSHEVVIQTRDEWSTQFDLGVSFDQGLQLERIELTEENLLGQGVLAEAYFARRREQRDRGFRVKQPRLFGTRTDALIGFGSTRVGDFIEQELTYPFVGEVGRLAARQVYRRRDQLQTYATGAGADFTQVLLPFQEEWLEFAVAARSGRPGRLTLFGLGLSRDRVEFGAFPGDLELVYDNDFGTTFPGTADAEAAVSSQLDANATTRLNFMVGRRQIRYEQPRGLDSPDGEQDVPLGLDVGLAVGKSIGAFGVGGLPSYDDVLTRFRLFAGHDPGTSFVFFNVDIQARRPAGQDTWRDLFAEVDLYTYLRTDALPGHTIFLRGSGAGGWSVDRPFQLTLGGREALRGQFEEDAPGAQRLLFTIEDRILIRWPAPELFDFGFTLFADAGRMWAGDVPYGADTDWRGTLGIGFRLGLTAESRRTARIDLAFPVGVARSSGPVFRVTMIELLGIRNSFVDQQFRRTLRNPVGPDLFVIER